MPKGIRKSGRLLGAGLLTLCLTGVCGCALFSEEDSVTYPAPSGPCDTLYTYAPGFLMMDVLGGSIVTLDPGVREFPVYCSAREARFALVCEVSAGRLPRGDWGIFALDGGYEALGTAKAPGRYVLARLARLVDWVPERNYLEEDGEEASSQKN